MEILLPDNSDNDTVPRPQSLGLAGLPQELHLYLLAFLEWLPLANLRLTSRYYNNIIPLQYLIDHRTWCSEAFFAEELRKLRRFETDLWRGDARSFIATSLDPDLHAWEQHNTCFADRLPCYRCLQWLPSQNTNADLISKSAFSRGMSTGGRNLGSAEARKRRCIDCAIRTKLYPKGTRVKHSLICFDCGALAVPQGSPNRGFWERDDSWRLAFYCPPCAEKSEVKEQTWFQFRHELRWKKYEDSMTAGKRYGLEKTRRLKERALLDAEQPGDDLVLESPIITPNLELEIRKPRYCVIMKEMRYCGCEAISPEAFL